VTRVLRPGGDFLYTDFRRRSEVAQWDAALADMPLRMVSKTVIDADVLRGNEKNRPRKRDLINHHGAAMPRGFTRFSSDLVDWAFNGALRSGEFTYRAYHFVKE